MKRTLAYYILLVGTFIWCVSLFIPPAAAMMEGITSSFTTESYNLYSRICHQFDSHSIHIFGYKLAVCARCSCIYFGFFFGVLLAPFGLLKKYFSDRTWLVISVIPMLLDVLLGILGLHEMTLVSRILTGSFFGLISGPILTPIFIQACNEL